QSNFGGLNSALSHLCENLGSEVQPGRRSRHRPTFPRVNCLVALAISGTIFAGNVWRQGDVPDFFQKSEEMVCGSGFRLLWRQPVRQAQGGLPAVRAGKAPQCRRKSNTPLAE